jgi:hypothetical protein
LKTRFARLLLASALVTVSVALLATPASAVPAAPAAASVCDEPPGLSTTQTPVYVGNPATRVFGSPGGVLSISVGQTTTVSGSLQTTVTAEAGVIFAKASASVGITIGLSRAVTVTSGFTWTVPANQPHGWVEIGLHGYRINWSRYHYVTPCRQVTDRSGTLVGVTSNIHFGHS